jgi:phytanoyl-CoA hydroxylase
MEPIAVRAGTLVIMHGLLPHASGRNATERSRHAYIVHAVDGAARYSPRNWLQRDAVPARGFRP